MERANKEVNRHIRNILADKEIVENWPQMLCMTEKLLNSSVKIPLRASPNTLLFGNAFTQEPFEISEMDQQRNIKTPSSIRDYVEKFMHRQNKLLLAAAKSQQETNDAHLTLFSATLAITAPQLIPRSRWSHVDKANPY